MSAKIQEDDLDFEDDDLLATGEDIEDIELEVEDDTPVEDRGRPVAAVDSDDDFEDDEMAQYSAKIQARIRKGDAKRHDERRAKEQALRERDVAIADAQRVRQQAAELAARLAQASTATVKATKGQAETDIASIKDALKEAIELGEGGKVGDLTAKLVDAQTRFNAASAAEMQIKTAPRPQPQPQPQPQAPSISERQRSWTEKNSWFGRNRKMTALALGVHEDLIESGVAPESDLYYNKIDEEMRSHFPDEFKSSQNPRQKSSPPVAGVRRSAPTRGGKTVVRLTQSELSIARKLGVDPKRYAAEKARQEASE